MKPPSVIAGRIPNFELALHSRDFGFKRRQFGFKPESVFALGGSCQPGGQQLAVTTKTRRLFDSRLKGLDPGSTLIRDIGRGAAKIEEGGSPSDLFEQVASVKLLAFHSR